MIQPQWPGLGRTFDPTPFDAAGTAARGAASGGGTATLAVAQGDAVAGPWWACGTGALGTVGAIPCPSGGADGSGNTLSTLISNLIGRLQQLVGGFIGESGAENGTQRQFNTVDVSSTGDPHLAASGTLSGSNAPLTEKFDSMTAHDDLVHSTAIDGGYRVSTAVTQPDANGVTANQSATVHANYDGDRITMNRDGSYAISDDGDAVQLAKGGSLELAGGETVTSNADGSLTVAAANAAGGTIATTMRATGGGVDVTTHAQNLAVGGDVVNHDLPPVPGTRHHGHGHKHHRDPLTLNGGPAPTPVTPPPLAAAAPGGAMPPG